MTLAMYSAEDLPPAPLEAAAHFYSRILPAIREDLPHIAEVIVTFARADHAHQAWRLAAIQALAREAAPKRVNGIVGGDLDAVRGVCDFLERAPGITGQLLAVGGDVDGKSGESG